MRRIGFSYTKRRVRRRSFAEMWNRSNWWENESEDEDTLHGRGGVNLQLCRKQREKQSRRS